MRPANRIRGWAWRRIPGCHPRIELLLEWIDGAAGRDTASISAHVSGCSRCRECADNIRLAERNRDQADQTVRDLFANLELRIEMWTTLSGRLPIEAQQKARSSRVVRHLDALEMYFGAQTAKRVGRSIRHGTSDNHVMPAIEPLFSAFLGRTAAEALARQIAGNPV